MLNLLSIRRAAIASSFLIVANLANLAQACPTCKNDLQHSGSEFGFAASILFMIGTPFLILVGWTIAIIRLRRKMKAFHPSLLACELLAAEPQGFKISHKPNCECTPSPD